MEELQLTLTPSRVDQRNFGLMLSNWRVGQVLNALVVDRMPSGNVLLSVGGREFVTSLDLPVQAGSRLQLEVQQLQPQVTLKMLGKGSDIGSTQLARLIAKACCLAPAPQVLTLSQRRLLHCWLVCLHSPV